MTDAARLERIALHAIDAERDLTHAQDALAARDLAEAAIALAQVRLSIASIENVASLHPRASAHIDVDGPERAG